MIPLHPLFFANEARENIVDLVVQTFKRLKCALGNSSFTLTDLWLRIDSIMTDAAGKNLEIEKWVAAELNSEYIPNHLLCKSHTCERLDADNIGTLARIERKLNLR